MTTVCYVRDRDFDHFPPVDLAQPTVHEMDSGAVLGWRWCRHEIENYLIDPELVHAALGWDRPAYEAEIILAASALKHYQAARWAAGQARQVLPPAKEFPNRPLECKNEFHLPGDLSEPAVIGWIRDLAAEVLARVETALARAAIEGALAANTARLTDAIRGGVPSVLLWYSGKDLLAGLRPWLEKTYHLHPTQVLIRIQEWVAANPDETLKLFPEWDALRNLLRSYP